MRKLNYNTRTSKFIVNTRDELSVIDLDRVAYLQACGNYTKLFYASGLEALISVGLSKFEALISAATPTGEKSSFYRLGRSLIINQHYMYHINVLHQRLILMGDGKNTFTLEVPKPILKNYKNLLVENYHKY